MIDNAATRDTRLTSIKLLNIWYKFTCISDDVERKDITIYCENVIKVIDNAATRDTRLTSIKLLDAWQGKGPGPLKVKV